MKFAELAKLFEGWDRNSNQSLKIRSLTTSLHWILFFSPAFLQRRYGTYIGRIGWVGSSSSEINLGTLMTKGKQDPAISSSCKKAKHLSRMYKQELSQWTPWRNLFIVLSETSAGAFVSIFGHFWFCWRDSIRKQQEWPVVQRMWPTRKDGQLFRLENRRLRGHIIAGFNYPRDS